MASEVSLPIRLLSRVDMGNNTSLMLCHRTTEWFLVYLLSEVGCTPHPIRQGFNAPSMEHAYSVVIQDLVSGSDAKDRHCVRS